MDDTYAAGETIAVTVTPSEATAEIRYTLQQLAEAVPGPEGAAPTEGKPAITGTVPATDGTNVVDLPATGPGLYRLPLSGGTDVEPVSDLLVVAPR